MTQSMLKIVGLGPGDFGLITLDSWEQIRGAENLYLRTKVHPTVAELERRNIKFTSYDDFYENAVDFAALYEKIARDMLCRTREAGEAVYAVPGSPSVAERTVTLLTELAPQYGAEIKIYPGMSFLEVIYERLGFDPIDGVTILDAADLSVVKELSFALIITQVYARHVASEVKLQLMDFLPDDYGIIYIHNLSLPDESIRHIGLYELDRQNDIDHLTCLLVPK